MCSHSYCYCALDMAGSPCCFVVPMYVDTSTVKRNHKSYTRHLLRTSFRQNGKVRHKTIANLSLCSDDEIAAIKLALKHKKDISSLVSLKDIETTIGRRVVGGSARQSSPCARLRGQHGGPATAQTIHDRYCDLENVERAFRTMKTAHLEMRPIDVRKKKSTRGHVFVVMLALLLQRELERCWTELDITARA